MTRAGIRVPRAISALTTRPTRMSTFSNPAKDTCGRRGGTATPDICRPTLARASTPHGLTSPARAADRPGRSASDLADPHRRRGPAEPHDHDRNHHPQPGPVHASGEGRAVEVEEGEVECPA